MLKQLEELKSSALRELEAVTQVKELEAWRVRYLGKKSQLNGILRSLAILPLEERKKAGALANQVKASLEDSLEQKKQLLRETQLATTIEKGHVDITLPGRLFPVGRLHPITQTLHEICDIFVSMGFQVVEGPEVEWDYYNFEALNFPPHHPARDDWDTLYITDDLLLRTHTSPVQIRVMEKQKPPIRIIIPGKVYRKEAPDPTHLPMFFQLEGLVVDKNITFAHLKGTLEYFLKTLFQEKINIRFRPGFFPFTEPSAEVDIECTVCGGKNRECRVCGGEGWMEILGSGMVDPQVLKNVNIDPEQYSGFAFGLGIDRTAMFAYEIQDMRYFYENDLRFIRQFALK